MNLDGGSFTTVVAREEERDRARHNPSGPQLPISCVRYGLPKPEPVDDSQVRSVADAVLVIPKHQK